MKILRCIGLVSEHRTYNLKSRFCTMFVLNHNRQKTENLFRNILFEIHFKLVFRVTEIVNTSFSYETGEGSET